MIEKISIHKVLAISAGSDLVERLKKAWPTQDPAYICRQASLKNALGSVHGEYPDAVLLCGIHSSVQEKQVLSYLESRRRDPRIAPIPVVCLSGNPSPDFKQQAQAGWGSSFLPDNAPAEEIFLSVLKDLAFLRISCGPLKVKSLLFVPYQCGIWANHGMRRFVRMQPQVFQLFYLLARNAGHPVPASLICRELRLKKSSGIPTIVTRAQGALPSSTQRFVHIDYEGEPGWTLTVN